MAVDKETLVGAVRGIAGGINEKEAEALLAWIESLAVPVHEVVDVVHPYHHLDLAIRDAANNCERRGAVVEVVVKGGVVFQGKIRKSFLETYKETITLESSDDSYTIIEKDEIAAIRTKHGPKR